MKTAPKATLAGVRVGGDAPVRIMGVINVSPESFFRGSITTRASALARIARQMTDAGADFLDVGALSTAPYLRTRISETEEARRLYAAIPIIHRATRLPISIDTSRLLPAMAGLTAGGVILNDVTGLAADPRLGPAARRAKGVILMAHPGHQPVPQGTTPLAPVRVILRKALQRARENGVADDRIVLDPGIGFFRKTGLPWWRWDLDILRHLPALLSLGRPLLTGVSRKSFIGHITGQADPRNRLSGSLAATTAAVLAGAAIIRTHDVRETRDAVLIAQALRDRSTQKTAPSSRKKRTTKKSI